MTRVHRAPGCEEYVQKCAQNITNWCCVFISKLSLAALFVSGGALLFMKKCEDLKKYVTVHAICRHGSLTSLGVGY